MQERMYGKIQIHKVFGIMQVFHSPGMFLDMVLGKKCRNMIKTGEKK